MKRLYSTITLGAALSATIIACQTNLGPTNNPLESTQHSNARNGGEVVENEILVKFKNGISASKKAEILDRIGGKVKEKILTKMMERIGDTEGVTLVEMPMGAFEALSRVKDLGEVAYAEPNYVYQHNATSNDPYFTSGQLWGMSANGNAFGSGAATAWANNKTGSSTVFIGIIDEGYMYTHPDLAANAGTTGDIPNNGIDDNGNGYIDDTYGWDFAGNDKQIFDGAGDDHGTHVAGTIGGVGGNSVGVAGVCWNVKLIGGKFLGSRGGTTANAIKAVDYFTDLKVNRGINIVATNNSWGGGGFSQALQDAISRANNAGILFVAAAGNNSSNNDATANYPSNYNVANVIAVASITSTGGLSSFSNYGATQVDLGAPGSGIWSTVPVKSGNQAVPSYASYNGTSMATPHVAGAVALYKSINPSASAAQIKTAILSSVIPTASLNGKTATGGRLNVTGF
ncbi:MAG: S8 family serine peptidase [Spirosomaceae bacterium]|jgi:subtilisin family serine protease|nr:S8 family serine peptidase [Spirosomataceae bacterium]